MKPTPETESPTLPAVSLSPDKVHQIEQEVIRLNRSAMRSLSQHRTDAAQSALKRASLLLESNPELSAQNDALVDLTLNNQACYYNTYPSLYRRRA